ncbi:MAG TPA: glycosyltransferase [Gemmatimonadales bacterium]|nr:glycosyltransferase [Gemmatimonadales bacterium]
MQSPTQFHILSFEGPDAYSRAGGIASRVTGLGHALRDAGHLTHLWFIGDPELPGHETVEGLRLHRWCQWISRHHPAGVYDGQDGKQRDLAASLPPFLVDQVLGPHLRVPGTRAVVLAEEWQTVDAVLHLDWLLRAAGLRDRVALYWNANNLFGFDRVPWRRLGSAATITTVSRYMRQRMWGLGVDALVIPNGLERERLRPVDDLTTAAFRDRARGRAVLAKVARWDPDKRWLLAVDTVAELKRQGHRPLLVARGGIEAHGAEVLARAAADGLRISERDGGAGAAGLLAVLRDLEDVDLLVLRSPLSPEACRLLYRGSHAVLANSGHEPFGLVGLETMAAGGLACTGGTGEDYAVPGWNALVLQTRDPNEFVRHFGWLARHPEEGRALRRHGRLTARQYTWNAVVARTLLPQLGLSGRDVGGKGRTRRPPRSVSRAKGVP